MPLGSSTTWSTTLYGGGGGSSSGGGESGGGGGTGGGSGGTTVDAYTKTESDAKYRTIVDSYDKADLTLGCVQHDEYVGVPEGQPFTLINTSLSGNLPPFQLKALVTQTQATPANPDAMVITPHNNYITFGVDAYTKSVSDGKYRTITDSYTKTECDGKYLTSGNYYSKTDFDNWDRHETSYATFYMADMGLYAGFNMNTVKLWTVTECATSPGTSLAWKPRYDGAPETGVYWIHVDQVRHLNFWRPSDSNAKYSVARRTTDGGVQWDHFEDHTGLSYWSQSWWLADGNNGRPNIYVPTNGCIQVTVLWDRYVIEGDIMPVETVPYRLTAESYSKTDFDTWNRVYTGFSTVGTDPVNLLHHVGYDVRKMKLWALTETEDAVIAFNNLCFQPLDTGHPGYGILWIRNHPNNANAYFNFKLTTGWLYIVVRNGALYYTGTDDAFFYTDGTSGRPHYHVPPGGIIMVAISGKTYHITGDIATS